MANSILIRGGRVIDPAQEIDEVTNLAIKDGRIAGVGRSAPQSADEVVDAGGLLVTPGLIDMHVHLREPGYEENETIETGTAAAAAGGYTAVACMPNTDPPLDNDSAIEFVLRQAARSAHTRVYPIGALTHGRQGKELAEIGLMVRAGAIAFSDDGDGVADAGVCLRAMRYVSMFDRLFIQHCEDPALAGSGCMHSGTTATRLGLSGIPAASEVVMVQRDLTLAAQAGVRYHVAHVSTAAAVDAIRKAKQEGLRITCDTAPPYFSLNETEIGDYRTFAKLSPPLRNEADRRAIAAALADGVIDCIASDHAPHDVESKRVPFAQAEPGIVGLETLLPIALEPYHKGAMKLIAALRCLTSRPADILGLPQGRLAKGAPADMVLLDTERPYRIDVAKFKSKSKNSPYDGRPVQGIVLKTFVDGRAVFALEGERA